MKSAIIVATFGLLSSAAFASTPANTYVCHSQDAVLVSFTTVSRNGAPALEVRDGNNQATLSTPTVRNSQLGYQVSSYVIDGPSDATISYTLIAPYVLISDSASELTVDAMLVNTFSGGLVPPSITYASQNNKYTAVICTASDVQF